MFKHYVIGVEYKYGSDELYLAMAAFLVLVTLPITFLTYRYSFLARRKRRNKVFEWATKAGLDFRQIDNQYVDALSDFAGVAFRDKLGFGISYDVGVWRSDSLGFVGDILVHRHMETKQSLAKFWGCICGMHTEADFGGNVTIAPPVALFDQIRKATGQDGVKFESQEFSESFLVLASSKKLAYQLVNPRVMAWLLDEEDCWVCLDHGMLFVVFPRVRPVEEFSTLFKKAQALEALLPRYDLEESAGRA
ncbi:MAG: DUF3137 domain-containing protein [Planctomycetes bacterium]|nr:DUF3137 domain-containing protein [Planctomycetota bacterium]